MNELLQTAEELRRLSEAELTKLGEDSLLNHLRHQAVEARARHGGVNPGNLETFLNDRDCVRYPTRLVLEYGDMGLHQFAQPAPDVSSTDPDARVLYLRPVLGKRPDLVALAVSYMIPVLNFGRIITDEHCLEYGAALMGMNPEAYYDRVCELADFVGAEVLAAGEGTQPTESQPAGGCGGCSCH